MERKIKSELLIVEGVTFYREDIVAVAEIIAEVGKECRVETEIHRFVDSQEFFANEKNLKLYEMKLLSPTFEFEVTFNYRGATIITRHNNLVNVGAHSKIADILRKSRRRSSVIISGFAPFIYSLLPFPIWYISWQISNVRFRYFLETIAALGSLVSLFLTILQIRHYGTRAIIYPKTTRSVSGFVERNWDQILVGFAIAIFTAVVSVAVTYLTR